MKILLCNIPVRNEPTEFPPVACTSLLGTLLKNGYDAVYYDLDVKRPSLEELFAYFAEEKYDLVGISAVVSTGYGYTKALSETIKSASPGTRIILGGNLAEANEIILRNCKIDICAIGEGEKILLNLVRHLEKYGSLEKGDPALRGIKGITFLGPDGKVCFTGHEEPNRAVSQPDYDLIARFSDINNYIYDPMTRLDFSRDIRSHMPHRKGRRAATVFSSKGCVNACTFCHRWVRGYRIAPAVEVVACMKYLMEKYNVGFFHLADECFVEDAAWLEEFIGLVKPLDIIFYIGAARVSLIRNNPSIIKRLKEAGLVAIYFGMESGSDRILKIMEKNASPAENLFAARQCAGMGVLSSIQLVIGMPGENEDTIRETIEFVKAATGDLPYPPQISPNYLQSLPGTPSYEYLRKRGYLGKTIEDEERYLLSVSDVNAVEFRQYVNVSEEPLSRASLWQRKICISARTNWIKRHGYGAWLLHMKNDRYAGVVKNKRNAVVNRVYKMMKYFIFNSPIVRYRHIIFMENVYFNILLFNARRRIHGAVRASFITAGVIAEPGAYPVKLEDRSLRKILKEIKT